MGTFFISKLFYMSNWQIEFFGWYKDEASDKIWGYVSIGGDKTLYNFWGRRGKKMTFKLYDKPKYSWQRGTLRRLAQSKLSKGYVEIEPDQVETVVPGFSSEFETQLFMAKLFDNFHGKKEEE